MTDAQIESKFKAYEDQLGGMKKDFEVKLEAEKADARQWKETAEKSAVALKEFEAKAKKSDEDRTKVLAEVRKTEIKSFVDTMKKSGQIIPAQEEALTKLMESMTSEVAVHTFEAKDGSKTAHTQYSLMKQFIESLPKHKAFVSMTPANGAVRVQVGQTDTEVHYTDIKRGGNIVTAQVDDFDMDVEAKIYIDSQAKVGRAVSYEDALVEISRRQKTAQAA
jgi:hypothetical protein